MNANSRKPEIDISALTDDKLESTLAVSEILTRFHKQIAVNISDDEDGDADLEANDEINDASDHEGLNAILPDGKKDVLVNEGDVVISPQDVLSAIDYRHDNERYNLLSSVISTVKSSEFYPLKDLKRDNHDKDLDKLLEEEAQGIWRRMQNRIGQGRMNTDVDVNNLLEVMEVRMSKNISTEMLFDHSNEKRSSGMQASASTVLGVPSGNYLSTILPQCLFDAEKFEDIPIDVSSSDGKDAKCNQPTLPVPANSFTWKELLRISTMISKVPEEARDAIYTSALTNSILSGTDFKDKDPKRPNIYIPYKDKVSGEDKLLLSRMSELRGTDLVALWVRAQRDTGASRHLLGLFEISEIPEQDIYPEKNSGRQRNEVINVDDDSNEVPTEISFVPDPEYELDSGPRHTATYVGNPTKMKTRIEKEAPMMDKLVEWAIINQVYFTQEHMRKRIDEEKDSSTDVTNGSRKRKRDETATIREYKRSEVDLKMTKELMIAYQSYLLRWFYRRNRNILKIVVSSNTLNNEEVIDYLSSMDVDGSRITNGIKSYLNSKFQSTDRTLSRIDRRILLHKYLDFSAFQDSVFHLLEALGSTLSENENLSNQLKVAEDDFAFLCDAILPNDKDHHVPLINIQSEEDEMHDDLIANKIAAQPMPWHEEKCDMCSKTMKKDTSKFCWNCGKTVHTPCMPSDSCPLPTSLDNYKYLLGVYMSAQDYPDEPDFVSNSIEWEEMEIVLQRKASEDGKLPRWGMTMQNTELCEESLDKSWHNIMNPLRWEEVDNLSTDIDAIPIRVPHVGMLVKLSKGAAMESGLKSGDVIVGVQVSLGNKAGDIATESEMKLFKDISNGDERKRLLVTSSQTMTFLICRPSKNIVSIAQDFKDAVVNAYEKVSEIHSDLMSRRWYCGNCKVQGNPPSKPFDDDASLCQMIIRRLGMEQSYLPFSYEEPKWNATNHDDQDGNDENSGVISIDSTRTEDKDGSLPNLGHFKYISLRRLDDIVDSLTPSASPLMSDSSSHYTPPWTKRERLCWSNERLLSNPFQLLCAGMILILRRAKDQGLNQHDRHAIVYEFVLLFIPWCLDYKGGWGTRLTKGPPACAQKAIAPWVLKSCKSCSVCPVEDLDSFQCTFCQMETKKQTTIVEASLLSEHLSCNELLWYDLYCSYIGTTLLVRIDDPLVTKVLKKTQLVVDEGRRNVELLVLSYVPRRLISKDTMKGLVCEEPPDTFDNRWQRAEGLFYILPICSHLQMSFISQFCDVRKAGESPSDSQMLTLDGIIALTPTELMTRMQVSLSMQLSVDRAVTSIATKFGNKKLPMMVVDENSPGSQEYFSSSTQRKVMDCDYSAVAQILCCDDLGGASDSRFFETHRFKGALDLCGKSVNSKSASFILGGLDDRLPHMLASKPLDADTNGSYYSHLMKQNRRSKWQKLKGTDIENMTNGSSSDLKYMNGMTSFDQSCAEKETICQAWYNDMVYWTLGNKNRKQRVQNDMFSLHKHVSKQILSEPHPFNPRPTDTKRRICVLHRGFCQPLEDDDEYHIESEEEDEYVPTIDSHERKSATFHGKGWGFELIRWRNDVNMLRVGRIVQSSPAHLAGLRTHDIVTAINGKPIQALLTKTALADELLGEVGIKTKEVLEVNPTIPILFSVRNKGPLQGPVVIQILRSDINFKTAYPQQLNQATKRLSQHRISSSITSKAARYQEPVNITTLPPPSTNPPLHHYQNNDSGSVVAHGHGQSNAYFAHPPHQPRPHPQQQVQHQVRHQPQQHYSSLPEELIDTGSAKQREILNGTHLYKASVNDTFLTLAETAVLVYAINHKHPKLSTRLLSPRYSLRRINDEYTERIKPFLQTNGFSPIPDLNPSLWQSILSFDHKRMQSETGPTIFVEDNFCYKEPNVVFPIDRFFEQFFRAAKLKTPSRNQHANTNLIDLTNAGQSPDNGIPTVPHQHQVNHNGDIMRIRGGGDNEHLPVETPFGRTEQGSVDGTHEKPAGTISSETIRLLNQMKESASSLLGVLPDGRFLYWFLSDPSAVYICKEDNEKLGLTMKVVEEFKRNADEARKENLAFIETENRNPYACPWGCCMKQDDQEVKGHRVLSFDTLKQWQDHIDAYHTYPPSPKHARFRRISDGRSIKHLCADLTSHLCSCSIYLHKFACEYDRNIESEEGFLRSPFSKSMIFDVQSFPWDDLSHFENKRNMSWLLPSIKVWSRLARLFKIEDDGTSRLLSPIDLRQCNLYPKIGNATDEKKLIQNIENGIKHDISTPHNAPNEMAKLSMKNCSCKRFLTMPSENLDCRVCRQKHESILKSKEGEEVHHGVGCSLVSDLCYAGNKSAVREKILLAVQNIPPAKGDLHLLKVFVMKVAANIPLSIHKPTMPMFSDPPLSSFWEHIDKWIRFTCRCSNIRMIGQAVIMLISSINSVKLPRWWKSSKCGWDSPLVLLQNPTVSSISFFLFTFDVAVCEYAATSKDDENQFVDAPSFENNHDAGSPNTPLSPTSPNRSKSLREGYNPKNAFEVRLEKMDVKEKYKLLEALAAKFGLQQYDDEYEDACMTCGAGGDLLCCEYCQNVIHQQCSGYEGDLEDVIFVCNECVADITTLKEAWDNERK